jgi:hypothetical protein
LIIARPVNPIAPVELERIEKYLNQGGRLLVLLGRIPIGPQRGLERLLANWGVAVGENRVVDRAQSKAGELQQTIVTSFGDHAIVKPLRGSRLAMILPRSVSQRIKSQQSADAPKVAELAFTGPEGIASRLDNRTELTGSIPLMACVEKGSIPGISLDRGATRLIVVGESSFLGNGIIESGANRDFARNAVNWLLNRDLLLEGISPHPIKDYRIIMTEGEMKMLRRVFLAGFPGSVMLCGFLVWLRRRS